MDTFTKAVVRAIGSEVNKASLFFPCPPDPDGKIPLNLQQKESKRIQEWAWSADTHLFLTV